MKRGIMKNQFGYLDICQSVYRKWQSLDTLPDTAEVLLEYSVLRLGRIGMAGAAEKSFWQNFFDSRKAEIIASSGKKRSETTTLYWPFHPGAAWLAARSPEEEELKSAGKTAAEQLLREGHRNSEGLFDDPVYPGHLSTEILAMTVPFLAWTGRSTGEFRFFDEAASQIKGYAGKLYDRISGLWHPGFLPGQANSRMWDMTNKSPLSQELYLPETGIFPGCWGRGEGYALFAISELVFELPDEHPEKSVLLALRGEMLEKILPYQDSDGMWHQVLDDWGSYPESSGTAWILYALGRAFKRGTIDREKFLNSYLKGLAGLNRYLAFDGSVFNGSTGSICPGGRGTAVDFALTRWLKNERNAFAPVLLALQQAAQIEHHTGLIPPLEEVMKQFAGGER